MDGFSSKSDNILVIGATNRLDDLDEAAIRPGGFDWKVQVKEPNLQGIKEILQIHMNKIKHEDINVDLLALHCLGFSGAELAGLVQRAAVIALRRGGSIVEQYDFDEAYDEMTLGEFNEDLVIRPESLAATAYHESGHALLQMLYPNSQVELYKVTIAPRGQILGTAHYIYKHQMTDLSKEDILNDVRMLLAGRAAEELVFGLISAGASNDFERATDKVRDMICKYGMTDTFGKVVVAKSDSPEVEAEIKKILDREYAAVMKMLKANRDKLDALAQGLLEKTTLTGKEAYDLIGLKSDFYDQFELEDLQQAAA